MNCKHFWGALKKQAHGRWSQEETDVLLSEWRKLRRHGSGVQSGYLGLSYDDWCRLANAVNAYRASAGLDSVRTYRQCKSHLRYFMEKYIELDACGAAAGEARRRGSASSASEGYSMTCETGKKKTRRDHDAASSEAFWGHHPASASGLLIGRRGPKKPRSNSAFAGGSSWSVKEERVQQGTKGRGREATSGARGGAAPASSTSSQLFGGPVHRAMAAGSADAAVVLALTDAYMNIRLKEIEKDRAASAATKKEAAKGRGRGGPSMIWC